MSNHELDEALRRKLSEPTKPSARLWSQIEAALPAANTLPLAKRNNYFLPLGIAASVAVLLAIGGAIWIREHNVPDAAIVHQQRTLVPKAEHVPAAQQPSNAPLSPALTYQAPSLATIRAEKLERKTPSNAQQPSKISTLEQEMAILPHNAALSKTIVPQVIALPQPVLPKQILPAPITTPAPRNVNNASSYASSEMLLPASQSNANQHSDALAMSVGGGYQYGNLNSGVAMNVNARVPIGRKAYLEGTAGVVINNSTENTLRYNGDFIANKARANSAKSRPGGSAVAFAANNPYKESTGGLYYLQINPSIGYSLSKKFDISAGPDYQQMINSSQSQDIVFFGKNQESNVLPVSDFGITAKIEYKLSPRLKTGFQVRDGVNNIIRNENNYANRRYMQVQLKYQLPTK